jgi:type I restriction enzyme S subunit
MKSNYKRIGDHIRLVDERNKGLKVKQLLGLSISKQFIPSVANIIGTDMENYKIIRKNQFACSTMQVRRDKKMPVALLKEVDEAIISQAYPIFEVNNEKELLPEYLMMWFTRSEFDREACFHAVGGVRGSLEWEDFENLQLPIPHPNKQREIVKEYKTIQNRITLNQQLIQKLEETAQAIYREWFVDFEFPDENGKPYKSSGGEMVWCEEFKKEIPIGWNNISLETIAHIIDPHPSHRAPDEAIIGFPFAGIGDIDFFGNIDINKARLIGEEFVLKQERDFEIDQNSIGYGRVGTVGKVVRLRKQKYRYALSPTMAVINPKDSENSGFVFYSINNNDFYNRVTTDMTGSTRPAIGIQLLRMIQILQPGARHQSLIVKYNKLSKIIIKSSDNYGNENQKLSELKELLLSRLARVEETSEKEDITINITIRNIVN